MPARFALRIESGEQAGETHAIGGGGLTVGRRPGNDLVIRDASVSGRHARFSIEGDRVVLVDFGSTNGSFVDDQRVDQATLEAGTFLRLGAIEVELVALDGEASPAASPGVPAMAPPPVRAPAPKAKPARPAPDEVEIQLEGMEDEPAELEIEGLGDSHSGELGDDFDDDGDGVHQIDGAALAASKRGPGLVPLLAGVVLLGGAAAWCFMGMPGLGGGGSSDGPVQRTAVSVPGNLLNDSSFESGAGVAVESDASDPDAGPPGAWTAEETASITPFVSEAWRFGGEVGLGTDLEAGEWAQVHSAPTTVGRQRQLVALATTIADGGGRARLGIELSDAAREHPVFTAWSATLSDAGGQELELSLLAPAGYDRARVVLDFATGDEPGAVGFDDVSLVATSGSGGAVAFGDFTLLEMGPNRLALAFIDRPMLVDMDGTAPRAGARGVAFTATGRFAATLDPALLSQGLATLGAGGYQPHGDAFEDQGVTSIVIGSGVHQLRLVFPTSVTLSGRPVTQGYRIEADLTGGDIVLELGFTDERARAARLDSQARDAEAKGQRGQALGYWQELLDQVPFDGALVLAAEANRGRLIAAGLGEVDALVGDFERAAFFGLPDLYRACLDGALELEAEFQGSEVVQAIAQLKGEVITALEASSGRDPRAARLAAARSQVLELTRAHGAAKLAEHIQAALESGANKEND